MWSRLEPLALGITLALAFLIASLAGWQSLALQHADGEQRLYVGLAMKLGTFGPKPSKYNLHGIGIRPQNETVVYYPQFAGQGDLLRELAAEGASFYDQPLFHGPPLYPALLSLSHGLLASGQEHAVLAREERVPELAIRWRAQGWAVFPTLLIVLLWVGTSYRLGREFGGPWMGAGCALLLASSPAFLLVAQRLWADSLLGLCMTVCVWVFLRKNGDRRIELCGLFLGLALLTKNAALLLALPLVVGASTAEHRGGWASLWRVFSIALVVTALWYVQAVRVLGTPFFTPQAPGISALHPWFEFLNARPWYTYLLGIPYQNPFFAVGLLGIPMLLRARARAYRPLLAWAISSLVLVTIYVNRSETLGPDHRYLLPAYPAFAILALHVAHQVALRYRPGPARLVRAVTFAWSVAWSLHVWWPLRGGEFLAVPF